MNSTELKSKAYDTLAQIEYLQKGGLYPSLSLQEVSKD